MTPALSSNTQAILLLTAPLIAGRGGSLTDLLSPGEYKRLARHLRDMQRQPADLLSPDVADLVGKCEPVIEESRLRRLLGRGFLLSQVAERWQARAIWVSSRADAGYPQRLKARLREDAPAVLYGCGDVSLLETGGLAVVGSRDVGDTLIDYATNVGRLAASAGRTLVSGGAKGIDQAAMLGALEAGGNALGVLADSLEKNAMNREQRNRLIDGQLVLISPYDPGAGFNVGNAMARNKLIYALADAALVVSSDLDKGGTWAGAVEQLGRFRMVPVFVRSTGEASAGIDALRERGAMPWPNPQDAAALEGVFDAQPPPMPDARETEPSLFSYEAPSNAGTDTSPAATADPRSLPKAAEMPPAEAAVKNQRMVAPDAKSRIAADTPEVPPGGDDSLAPGEIGAEISPAEALFAAVRSVLEKLLTTSMKEAEIAEALQVPTAQAKIWLHRLVDEGVLEKRKKPSGYMVKQSRLL